MKFKYINGLEFEVGNYSKYWDNNESDQIYEKVKYLQFNSEAGVRTLEIYNHSKSKLFCGYHPIKLVTQMFAD